MTMAHQGVRRVLVPVLALLAGITSPAVADELAKVEGVELQPLAAQVRRVADALSFLGQPLQAEQRAKLEQAIGAAPEADGVRAIQDVLDPLCLVGVSVNAESRVKAQRGPAEARLVQNGWRVFLVKVQNEAGVTAPLKGASPNAAPPYKAPSFAPEPAASVSSGDLLQRWCDVQMFNDRPLTTALSGLGLEYRLIQVYSRDAGKREARFTFDVGQGTQDLGFRSDADILFHAEAAVPVVLDVLDEHGKPTTASFLIRDRLGRVYPSQSKRLAPDFFFHPQIYRTNGETVSLPPGNYDVEFTRGPEYLTQTRRLTVPTGSNLHERFQLERWIDLTKWNWFSGDHHVHAAGCAHYESPTEGVGPADMMRHILGEDLKVGCVLSWGPCWYAQKKFFEGKLHPLSTPDYLMRYDVEVSGFPSSHAGHLCLLRLKEDDYPGTTRIEEWPSWDLPVLRWGKEQGGVVGFSHSGWGLQTKAKELPNYEIPPFDGIGANEYIVDVVHDAVDFISSVDTPAPYELNIWYHTLNCGYRCKISGETDFPCIYGERVGLGRVYVKLEDGSLDYDRWAEGLRQGRSYVGDGLSHLIDFRVNDQELGKDGGELKLAANGPVQVSLKVAARLEEAVTPQAQAIKNKPLDQQPYWHLERARVGGSRKVPVEIVVNGVPVATQEIEADGQVQDLQFNVPIERSSWVAARIYPSSHTNPIWVTVAEKPVRASRRSAEWCLKSVDQCWSKKESAIRASEREAAQQAYEAARQAYRRILGESEVD